ncbi:hypothetical protein A4H97_33270 [Niastella yeongjuensis]|uniref:Uncharacterized protein n=1 Tax=Niastella yeongjuensis TaxID=354355 RepID=A0A1V9EDL5_9BACT|nr:hypothetical protein [Niastella yeongjuensis]OQP44227.1 hypothetical protein A4H97_33270 [Niastella yeongjuensis]SEO40219.1 hypothetical protein SAMN05660816_02828 [Niastella yeongjuensis]
MGLLDLDKIVVHRTIIGIRCISCEGSLLAIKTTFSARLTKLISFGKIKPTNYECETCKKKYVLL